MKEPQIVKIEIAVPVFLGCLGSLILCAFIAARGVDSRPLIISRDSRASMFDDLEGKPMLTGGAHFFAKARQERQDIAHELYRKPESQERVIDFFAQLCPSREIAEAILISADWFNIPPSLAFALAWEESQLNPLAVNGKNKDGSVDRGLFQLNNRSFPHLEIQAYFSPDVNAWYGMNHLRHCLDTGRSEIAALAMYNAGTSRVTSSGTPKSTLDYISRILENKSKIESSFHELESWYQDQQIELEALGEFASERPDRPRLMPLKPLKMGK